MEDFIDNSRQVEIEQAIFRFVNEERVKHNLKPLNWVERIAAACRMHSFYLLEKNKFVHKDEAVKSHVERLNYYKITDYTVSGENIGAITSDGKPDEIAREFVDAWMESKGHRENILFSDFTDTGIGVMEDFGDTFLATQVFIGRTGRVNDKPFSDLARALDMQASNRFKKF